MAGEGWAWFLIVLFVVSSGLAIYRFLTPRRTGVAYCRRVEKWLLAQGASEIIVTAVGSGRPWDMRIRVSFRDAAGRRLGGVSVATSHPPRWVEGPLEETAAHESVPAPRTS